MIKLVNIEIFFDLEDDRDFNELRPKDDIHDIDVMNILRDLLSWTIKDDE